MMVYKYKLEILAIIAVVAFCMLILGTNLTMKGTEFVGTDTIAAAKISEFSGTPDERINPLIPQWVPPSGEVEGTLFALQAAVGGFFIGCVFGYWIGQKKRIIE
jgi:cobalt/nickel transport protein